MTGYRESRGIQKSPVILENNRALEITLILLL